MLVLKHLTLNASIPLLYIIRPQSICIHIIRTRVHVFVFSKDLSSALHNCAAANINQARVRRDAAVIKMQILAPRIRLPSKYHTKVDNIWTSCSIPFID